MEERALIWTGYAVIVIVVFLSMFFIMNKMIDNIEFKQERYAIDISLAKSVLLNNDYDTNLKISIDPEFDYSFQGCKINVNEIKSAKESASEYYCADNLNVKKIYDNQMEGDFLFFNLKDGELSVIRKYDE